MTEQEWLTCTDPTPMLRYVQGTASDRKLRQFAVACCRLFWDELRVDATRTAIETNERYADLWATESELSRARSAAHSAAWHARFEMKIDPPGPKYLSELVVERPGVSEDYLKRMYFVAFMANTPSRLRADEMPMLRSDPLMARASPFLLRDIFGNPFRPVTADPAWLTSTVVSLAAGIYQDRAFDRSPILADALEDAGCDNADILTHLRSDGPHVRGCWALDLVLGKS
jgi:hypothetical protein